MSRVVTYCMSHNPHVPYLLVSLRTLREHWDGEVHVHAWPESIKLVREVEEDERLGIKSVLRCPDYRGKNDQFLDKIQMAMSYDSDDTVLYLDADTTVHGKVDLLFEMAEEAGFAATQWNDWLTNSGMPRGRIKDLGQYIGMPEDLIETLVKSPWPSVNGGVWACSPTSYVLPEWYKLTMMATVPVPTFIADEKVLHLMMAKYAPLGKLLVAEGGSFNCSPKYQPADLEDSDVVIRHYHGDSCLRPDKSRKGFNLWWPLWRKAIDDDLGGARGWCDKTGNKWLANISAEA